MNRERFCSTPQYKVWRKELDNLKYILRNLNKENIEEIEDCKKKISELRKKMKIDDWK